MNPKVIWGCCNDMNMTQGSCNDLYDTQIILFMKIAEYLIKLQIFNKEKFESNILLCTQFTHINIKITHTYKTHTHTIW